MRHVSVMAIAAAAVAVTVGCGSEHRADPAPAAVPPLPVSPRPKITPRPIVLRDQLFSVERRWPGIAIADRLAIDRHGGGRIVRGGGGGGLRIERCRFTAGEMDGWRRDLARLGPERPAGVSPQRWPATYLINYASRQRVVQSGAMPERYKPLAQRITRLLYRGGKGCHTIYSQRKH